MGLEWFRDSQVHKKWNDQISVINVNQSLTNEVSKCKELSCTSFDNVYFPTEDDNLKISVHFSQTFVLVPV